ncbi:MAG TPA: hypothetical protein VHV08_05495 [Pirellulales bacterium]|jgi:hypothetical protein|nr:hypothetical protein [Pirellulales bacterium]
MPYERTFDEPTGPLDRVCRHLRSKAIFVSGQLEPPAELEHTGSGHCWCNFTQHILGPDDQLVNRRECHSARPCYEAAL